MNQGTGAEDADEALLAEIFDQLLEEILDGRTPDLETLAKERPDLRPRSPAVTSCLRIGDGACRRSRPCLYIVSRIS